MKYGDPPEEGSVIVEADGTMHIRIGPEELLALQIMSRALGLKPPEWGVEIVVHPNTAREFKLLPWL